MGIKVIRAPNPIGAAYENLIEVFRGAVEDANRNVYLPSRPVRASFFQPGDNTSAEFKGLLYLKNCPCRRLSHDKRLDVAILALETFVLPSWRLVKSTVYVNYLVASGSKAELVQALHYDFVQDGQTCHPLFHAQLSDELISIEDISQNPGFDLEPPIQAPPNHCWVTTRIPTPDMTLASVLYCLVADHLEEGIFIQFARDMQAIQDRLPVLNFDPVKKSLQKSMENFKSYHWFEHMKIST